MSKHWNQHTGDDQLVYGLPKHMVGISTNQSLKKQEDDSNKKPGKVTIWTVHPKAKACEKCKAMEGIKYTEKPERPHPNCKCDIRKHEYTPGKKRISGILEGGFGSGTVEIFSGRSYVDVTVTNIGESQLPGVFIKTNHAGSQQAHLFGTGSSHSFSFNIFTDAMLNWSVMLEIKGASHAVLEYVIEYEQ